MHMYKLPTTQSERDLPARKYFCHIQIVKWKDTKERISSSLSEIFLTTFHVYIAESLSSVSFLFSLDSIRCYVDDGEKTQKIHNVVTMRKVQAKVKDFWGFVEKYFTCEQNEIYHQMNATFLHFSSLPP